MAARTYSIHAEEDIIQRIDQHAERLRRTRNSLINEAIEMLLENKDAESKIFTNSKTRKAGKK